MKQKLLDYFNRDEMAANVWLDKYAQEGEKTPKDMHLRLAKEFSRVEKKYRYIKGSKKYNDKHHLLSEYGQSLIDNYLTKERIYELFKDFKYIVPQGSVMYGLGRNKAVSLSNCFVIDSPKDSYGGIFLADQEQAQLMKRRGGVGEDISHLRPKNTDVNNSAKSSTGAISFMHRFSNTTREVAQDGRRGALMLSIDVNHPDIMDFIKIKRDSTSVTGANISIRLNDEFMKAVENDEDYILRFPCDIDISKFSDDYIKANYDELHYIEDHDNDNAIIYTKTVKAKEYWNEIIKSAKNYAEPGLMYWGNVLNYDPAGVYENFKPISSNPCGEQFLQAYDSCRLMALNLYSFVENPFTGKAKIDYKKLYEISYEQQRLADDLVDLEIEYIDRIISKIESDPEPMEVKQTEINLWKKIQKTAKEGRRTGCGITALGDFLAALGLKYDSEEALKVTDKVMKIKMEAELDCTIDLSILRGKFKNSDITKEYGIDKNNNFVGMNKFYRFVQNKFPSRFKKMCKFNRRNISWSTIAPTGSVSILTQTTSGCEPLFKAIYMRRKKINPNEKDVRVDFIDDNGDTWQEFPVLHEKFKDWAYKDIGISEEKLKNLSKADLNIIFKSSPWYKSTANDIDWNKRNEMQSILQKYTTNAISSTINLPSTVTEEEVAKIYFDGWKKGLKGQTIYVDGSRSGVLVSNDNKNNNFKYKDAVERPKTLEARSHITKIRTKEYNVVIGLFDDKPYEVFAFRGVNFNEGKGKLIKEKRGKYTYESDTVHSIDIGNGMTDEQAALTRMISTSLRHGANIKFIVEQLNKADGEIHSFTKAIARVLKTYIPDGEKSTITCDNCGSDNVRFEEGCNKCMDCGNSAC